MHCAKLESFDKQTKRNAQTCTNMTACSKRTPGACACMLTCRLDHRHTPTCSRQTMTKSLGSKIVRQLAEAPPGDHLIDAIALKISHCRDYVLTLLSPMSLRTWVSGVTEPLESFVKETTRGPQLSHVTKKKKKKRPAFIWSPNLFVFVRLIFLRFQYYSDLR